MFNLSGCGGVSRCTTLAQGNRVGQSALAMRLHHLISSAFALLVLGGCPSDDEPTMTAPEHDGGDTPFAPADCPDEVPELFIHMEATGASGLIKAEVIDADKIPLGWYHNDWVVLFTGPDGEPLEDVEMTKASTWMPVHGHGGGQIPTIMPLEDGKFDVDGLNISMGGPWQIIFEMEATNADGEAISDIVTFDLCNSRQKPETR